MSGIYYFVWVCMSMYRYLWVYTGIYGYIWVCKSGQVQNYKRKKVEKRKFGKVENWKNR